MTEPPSRPRTQAGQASLASRQWANLAMLTLSMFIIVLDVTVVLIALPAIQQDLEASLDLAAWVPGAFILTFAGLLLLFGKLADLYGRRRLFVTGMTVFTLASVASALAPSIEVLIGARVVQGIGAAIVEPAIIAVIKATFPSDKLGLAFGIEGQAAGLASVFGPIVGGLLTTTLGWESIFWINVPIGIVAVGMALLLIPESRDEHASRRIDLPGVIFSGAGLFALIFAIVEGPRYGWSSPLIVGAFIASVVLVALFIVTERRVPNPLVDLELFTDRLFSVGCFLRGAGEFVSAGIFLPLLFFLQTQLGYSALQSGLLLLPIIGGAAITGPLAGALSDRVDLRWPIIPAFLVGGIGLFWLAHLSPDTQWTFLIAPLAVVGAGLGAQYGPTTSGSLRNIPTARSGIASAVSYAAVTLGFELGIAVTSAVQQTQTAPDVTGVEAANAAILACAAMTLVGAIVAVFFTANRKHHISPVEAHPTSAASDPRSEATAERLNPAEPDTAVPVGISSDEKERARKTMMKLLGVTLVGFIVGAFLGGVLFDNGPGVDVVPLLIGVAGGGCAFLVSMRVFRRRSE